MASQNAGAAGSKAKCQTFVSVALAKDEVPLPTSLRLFLPET
jgi:hypothetical protein